MESNWFTCDLPLVLPTVATELFSFYHALYQLSNEWVHFYIDAVLASVLICCHGESQRNILWPYIKFSCSMDCTVGFQYIHTNNEKERKRTVAGRKRLRFSNLFSLISKEMNKILFGEYNSTISTYNVKERIYAFHRERWLVKHC